MTTYPLRLPVHEPAGYRRRYIVPIWISKFGIAMMGLWLGALTPYPLPLGIALAIGGVLLVRYLYRRNETSDGPVPPDRFLEFAEEEIRVYLRKGQRLITEYTLTKLEKIGVEPQYHADDVMLDRRFVRWVDPDVNSLVLEEADGTMHRFHLNIPSNEKRDQLDRIVRDWRRYELPVYELQRTGKRQPPTLFGRPIWNASSTNRNG